ncbi:MAG: hypothetical protein WCS37_03750, partial [Chloroflexota bacterium]
MTWILAMFSVPAPVLAQTELVPSKAKGVFQTWIAGINYEGYVDRGWKMWEDAYFDPALIEDDFRIARNSGYNSLRIFVQLALAQDLLAGDFHKLDRVVELAGRYNLKLLITLADYGESHLSNLLYLDSIIAAHLSGNPVILGYDLKNEPGVGDLMGVVYPDQVEASFQSSGGEALLKIYGERMSRTEVERWRSLDEGKRVVSPALSPEQAYIVANVYLLWNQYQQEASAWSERSNLQLDDAYWSDVLSSSAYKHQGRITDLLKASETLSLSLEDFTTSQLPYSLGLDYPASLEGSKWQPLVNSMNQALSVWVSLRKAALHSSDSSAQVTIGFNNLYLAALPANKQLNFLSPHFYGGGTAGLVSLMAFLTWLRKAFPQMPVVLGEFGASGVQWPDQPISEDTIASYETVVWL